MSSSSPLIALSAAAAAAAPNAPPWWSQLPLFIGLAVIMYFLLIRPQMKQQKVHREKIARIQKGDQVVTAGGLIAKVLRVDEHYVDLELAPGVKVKAVKSTIGDIVPPGGTQPAND